MRLNHKFLPIMKKIFLLSILLGLFTISCSSSKIATESAKTIRGDWTITNVSVSNENPAYVNINVFDEASYKCYQGSTWHLVNNNNSGYYTLNGGADCPSWTTSIQWFVSEQSGQPYFNFKQIMQGEKPKNVTAGYQLRIAYSTENSFMLVQDLMFEGKPLQVNYTFEKR